MPIGPLRCFSFTGDYCKCSAGDVFLTYSPRLLFFFQETNMAMFIFLILSNQLLILCVNVSFVLRFMRRTERAKHWTWLMAVFIPSTFHVKSWARPCFVLWIEGYPSMHKSNIFWTLQRILYVHVNHINRHLFLPWHSKR